MLKVNTGVGVNPGYLGREDLRKLLGSRYSIPEFQRGYAWEESNIDDYVGDLLEHFRSAAPDASIDAYFFGAIVTIKKSVGLARTDEVFEVIDGQQRLTTFYLTLAALKRAFVAVRLEADSSGDAGSKAEASTAVDSMDSYIHDLQSGDLRLVPAGVDESFYKSLLKVGSPQALPATSPSSHKRLALAAASIDVDLIGGIVEGSKSHQDRLTRLLTFAEAFLSASYVIHAGSEVEVDAYRLFLVLNDRGLELTEADLLKTRTLDLLRAFDGPRERARVAWEAITSRETTQIRAFLRAFYSMNRGKRPASKDLHRQFQEEWFKTRPTTEEEAEVLASVVEGMTEALRRHELLVNGTWPYSPGSASNWEKDRLSRLVNVLGSEASIPLLMALSYGPEKRFTAALLFLERFVFRYNLAGGHKSSSGDKLFEHAKHAREDPTWTIGSLEAALAPLNGKYAYDAKFEAALNGLTYSASPKLVRHLLTTLDDYLTWYERGGTGTPESSALKVFDLAQGDIDHIYPQNPLPGNKDASLDERLNALGNLAFLAFGDNRRAKNKAFHDKQLEAFHGAEAKLTSDLADTAKWPVWDVAHLEERQKRLVAIGMKVFAVKSSP